MQFPATTEQVGLGLITVILVKDLLVPMVLKKQRADQNAGDKSPEYWELKFKAMAEDVVEDHLVPKLEEQTKILRNIEAKLKPRERARGQSA